MRTNKVSLCTNSGNGYFEGLPQGTQEIIRDLILDAAENRAGPEGWKSNEEAIEQIECHSRDGFIRSSFNYGGLEYRNFACLMDYFAGGYSVAHAKANAEIRRQIKYSLQLLRESTFEKYKDLLTTHGVALKDTEYLNIQECVDNGADELTPVLRYIEDNESEYLGGENSSIMHSIRVMYHGKVDGTHSASVSAAVNTEGPYHRSAISWAPSVFCEGAKEVEIEWTNQAELKKVMRDALAKVSKAVF